MLVSSWYLFNWKLIQSLLLHLRLASTKDVFISSIRSVRWPGKAQDAKYAINIIRNIREWRQSAGSYLHRLDIHRRSFLGRGWQGVGSGPICLGHLIPDLRHLDNVINCQGLYLAKAWHLTSEMEESSGAGVFGNVGGRSRHHHLPSRWHCFQTDNQELLGCPILQEALLLLQLNSVYDHKHYCGPGRKENILDFLNKRYSWQPKRVSDSSFPHTHIHSFSIYLLEPGPTCS